MSGAVCEACDGTRWMIYDYDANLEGPCNVCVPGILKAADALAEACIRNDGDTKECGACFSRWNPYGNEFTESVYEWHNTGCPIPAYRAALGGDA